ncbi:MAG: arginine--tRNA ligase [Pseudomonadota bacterium]
MSTSNFAGSSVLSELRLVLGDVLKQAFPDLEDPSNWAELTRSTHESFGDYQTNAALRLAKALKQSPKAIAESLAATLQHSYGALFSSIEIAGPGFINLSLSPSYITGRLSQLCTDTRCGIPTPTHPQRIVVDFSSPNIAKEMHVGHLRSTIIGDCLARVLSFLGHDVLRLNHIGDWGTSFGMLIAYFESEVPDILTRADTDLTQLLQWYRAAKQRFDADPNFKTTSQQAVVALQGGDARARAIWQKICDISEKAYQEIYAILDVTLTTRGESFYNPFLSDVIVALKDAQILETSEGAECVFLPNYTTKEGGPLPFIVQKSDGGYNYATTDLAAVRHRVQVEGANRIIYVTDAGQSLHFEMMFQVARLANFAPPSVRLDHVPFGLVLGADGKKFKTRSGDTERLIDLLTEAVHRAEQIFQERNPELSAEERTVLAKALGINAVKYADLVNNRLHDYAFSYDRMLKFEGNTAAFLMYAYVRTHSILRKVNQATPLISCTDWVLDHPAEQKLARQLLRFHEVLESVANDLMPNRLTEYLYELSERFHEFFHHCRVAGDSAEASRAALCKVTQTVLHQGLLLLGLRPITSM